MLVASWRLEESAGPLDSQAMKYLYKQSTPNKFQVSLGCFKDQSKIDQADLVKQSAHISFMHPHG